MKSYTFKEFRDICRKNIATYAEHSETLRKAKAAFPRADAQAKKAHADETHILRRRIAAGAANGEDVSHLIDKFEVLREQGRELRLKANVENGRRRAQLNQDRALGPRPLCRMWHWLYAMSQLKSRFEIENPNNDGIGLYVARRVDHLVAGVSADINSSECGFKIRYKYGEVTFGAADIEKWIFDTGTTLPSVAAYLRHASDMAARHNTVEMDEHVETEEAGAPPEHAAA